jgi:CRP-like cAMP-binding protein
MPDLTPSPTEGLKADPRLKSTLETVATALARKRGATLFAEGDPVNAVYMVRRGKISLAVKTDKGDVELLVAGPDYVLGLPAVLANRNYSLTARVVEDAELAVIPQQKALEVLRQDPQLCFRVVQMLSDEVRHLRRVIAHPLPIS